MSVTPSKSGWKLTFHDEFDTPQLDDMYWYPAYRSGSREYLDRIGKSHLNRYSNHNAHYVIEDSILKLRVDRTLPWRSSPGTPCVSCITTSDHRFGADTSEVRILDKFSQKYGLFEMRAKCPVGSGFMSAFWLHQVDPLKQEYSPDGEVKSLAAGPLEIDIFEQRGIMMYDNKTWVDINTHFTEKGHFIHTIDTDASTDFHTWALEWEEGHLVWYFDGAVMEEYHGPTPPEKMFLLAALFQCEGWLGKIDPATNYPVDFDIDYIRVWAKA